MMKRILPRAKNPESKKVIIPNRKKNIPPAVNPTPNSKEMKIVSILIQLVWVGVICRIHTLSF